MTAIRDLYTDRLVELPHTHTPTRISEGVYEGAIDRFYGLGEPIPDDMKAKYGYSYGFIVSNEEESYGVFGIKNGR